MSPYAVCAPLLQRKRTSNTNHNQYDNACKGNRFILKHYEHQVKRLRSSVVKSTQTSDRSNLTSKHFALSGKITKDLVNQEWLLLRIAATLERCTRISLHICYHTFSTNELKELNYSSFKVTDLHLSSKITVRIQNPPCRSARRFPWLAQGHAEAGLKLENCWFPISYLGLGNLLRAALFKENS